MVNNLRTRVIRLAATLSPNSSLRQKLVAALQVHDVYVYPKELDKHLTMDDLANIRLSMADYIDVFNGRDRLVLSGGYHFPKAVPEARQAENIYKQHVHLWEKLSDSRHGIVFPNGESAGYVSEDDSYNDEERYGTLMVYLKPRSGLPSVTDLAFDDWYMRTRIRLPDATIPKEFFRAFEQFQDKKQFTSGRQAYYFKMQALDISRTITRIPNVRISGLKVGKSRALDAHGEPFVSSVKFTAEYLHPETGAVLVGISLAVDFNGIRIETDWHPLYSRR